jgi:hypothetical protein
MSLLLIMVIIHLTGFNGICTGSDQVLFTSYFTIAMLETILQFVETKLHSRLFNRLLDQHVNGQVMELLLQPHLLELM